MIEKIKNYEQYLSVAFRSLQDVRTVGLIVFLVIVLLISWSGIKVIETNYKLQKDIAQFKQENDVEELENRNLELENQYYETDEYLELEARKNFGLAAPGETVLVVPKRVALANTVSEPVGIKDPDSRPPESKPKQNFEAWMDFFLHRTD